jgi:hypothetical protein
MDRSEKFMTPNNDEFQNLFKAARDTIDYHIEWCFLADGKEQEEDASRKLKEFVAKQLADVEELKEQLEHALNPLHSCSSDCKRPACVFRRERDSLKRENERMREALQRLWEEDEMGWIVDDTHSECVKCGAKGLTALPLIHNDGCVQGYIYAAISTPPTNAENKKDDL